MQTYDLFKFALARFNGSSFLLITQYEIHFINYSEATKRSKDRKKTLANVLMARAEGVVFGLSVLFTIIAEFRRNRFVLFASFLKSSFISSWRDRRLV